MFHYSRNGFKFYIRFKIISSVYSITKIWKFAGRLSNYIWMECSKYSSRISYLTRASSNTPQLNQKFWRITTRELCNNSICECFSPTATFKLYKLLGMFRKNITLTKNIHKYDYPKILLSQFFRTFGYLVSFGEFWKEVLEVLTVWSLQRQSVI